MNALDELKAMERSMSEQIRLANGQGKDTTKATSRRGWLRRQITLEERYCLTIAELYRDVAVVESSDLLPWETRHAVQIGGEREIPFAEATNGGEVYEDSLDF